MLKKIKQDSHNQFQQLGYPSKKLENWKFSSSSHLKKYKSESMGDSDLSIEQYSNKYTLCFINGELSQESLNDFFYKDHISISDIETFNDNEVSATSSNFKKEAFFHLGLSTIKTGKYFEFKKGVEFDAPIEIVNLYSKNSKDLRIASFNIFKINKGNNVSIIEKDINQGNDSFNLSLKKFICSDDSTLNHSMIHDDDTGSNYLGYNYYELGRTSFLNIDSINTQSTFNKNFIEVDLNKEGSEAKVNMLNLARNEDHLDNNILMNHNAEHCTSFQNVRNILDDESTCVFNGKVVVANGAQKTDSNQSNQNLLLSKNATAHSNPQLEIYADDVKCGHGSTTGALDKDSMFYLRARGIDKINANNMLIQAFAQEVLDEFVHITNFSEQQLNDWINE
jgi:Fe-S cluster assembly protein SufD